MDRRAWVFLSKEHYQVHKLRPEVGLPFSVHPDERPEPIPSTRKYLLPNRD
jgi:hypothetical protein